MNYYISKIMKYKRKEKERENVCVCVGGGEKENLFAL